MNHSKAFWAVRNAYAESMRGLWSRGYTGDGLWGRGTLLATGGWEANTVVAGEALPEHLCGGTYQSRRRKRKARPVLSYQERKERRILKKFGANGVALGADDAAKVKLEKGKRTMAKPRVAGSARGRELRAAAALARFEEQNKAKNEADDGDKVKLEDGSETESGSEYEDDATLADGQDALDIDGRRLLDGNGHGMVRVCGEENDEDADVKRELRELELSMIPRKAAVTGSAAPKASSASRSSRALESGPSGGSSVKATKPDGHKEVARSSRPPSKSVPRAVDTGAAMDKPTPCPICFFDNLPSRTTCTMCAHVLGAEGVAGSWQCTSASCNPEYRNAGDCGVCGICGRQRPDGG